jgi:membrane metallo-endopeptidase-like protein 1
VTLDEIVIVDVPSYLQKFSQFIQKTPARVQANYMLWRVAAASMKYLTEASRKISLKFSQKLTGKSEETPRSVFKVSKNFKKFQKKFNCHNNCLKKI